MIQAPTHISVCVCTYKRPELLAKLLNALEHQDSGGLFTYNIVVVDNDHTGSAGRTVQEFIKRSPIRMSYHIESERNIALARNRATANANGEFIAFVDDDEVPGRSWLGRLYTACNEFRADG